MGTEASPWAGSEIVRLKKEAFAANDLWRTQSNVPGGMERWLKAREEAKAAEDAQPEKKQKKVVKTRLTLNQIQTLRAVPCHSADDLPADMLASRLEWLHQMYIMRWYVDGKWADYLNALFKQSDLIGYAEDDDEVTDDDEEQEN